MQYKASELIHMYECANFRIYTVANVRRLLGFIITLYLFYYNAKVYKIYIKMVLIVIQ